MDEVALPVRSSHESCHLTGGPREDFDSVSRTDAQRLASSYLLGGMRHPYTLARAIRAMTAVITVWCIGCSGFEPLLDAAFGDGAVGMTCGSDRIETSAHAMDSAHALATVSAGLTGNVCPRTT